MSGKNTINLFVYGTLKKGRHNHIYLNDATRLGKYFTDSDFTLVVTGLPYMVKRPNSGGVKGELYKINEDILRRIDRLEGHPDFYKREEIYVFDEEVGSAVKAYAYIHPDVFPDHIPTRRSYE